MRIALRSFAVVALALAARLATAQTASSTLSGVISDDSGGAVVGATVTARNAATGALRQTTSDAAGRYSLANLEPGSYEVRCELLGFKTVVHSGVVLSVGGFEAADFKMSVGERTEEVTVVGEGLIETSKTDLSRVVATVEIESLPNIGRNFVDFVKLSSGVAIGRENIGGGAFKEADTGVGVAAAPRLSFGGQPELNTLIQVDGADNVQTFTGLPRATPSQEAAQEFRILNSTYLAEYGRALGGFVNIVTKSGTNDTKGFLYYYGMDDALASRPSLVSEQTNYVLGQHQYGGTLGGALAKDRTFYFVNYEGQRREESNRFSQVIIDNLATLNSVRRQFNLKQETLDQVRNTNYDQFLAKLDHRFGQNNRFALRYNYLDGEALNFPGGGGRASPASTSARNSGTKDQALVGSLVSILSPRVVNEARVQWAKRDYDFQATVNEPALEISNLIIMGKTTSDLDFYKETRFQATDSLLITTGGHQIKFGADFNSIEDRAGWNLFFPARIVFPNIAGFASFTPVLFWWPSSKDGAPHPGFDTSWTQAVPTVYQDETIFEESHSIFGVFAQDQWKATSKLTLTLGLRYDVESYPEPFIMKKDSNNVQPRVGFAYAYSPKGVIRAGFGIFTDRIASSVGQLLTASQWSARGDLANGQTLFPGVAPVRGRFYQNTIGGPGAPIAATAFLTRGVVPEPTRTGLADNMDGNLKNPYSRQASFQISHQVGGVALSASYLYVGARDVPIHGFNLNAVQTGVLATGKPIVAGRRFADLGDFFVTTNQGFSTYHGGTFEIQKRFSGGLGFHASYTYSRTRSNGDSVANLADIWEGAGNLEEAVSRQHVPHRFTLSFISQVPKDVAVLGDLKFSSLISLESGRFFTQYAGRDANSDGNPNSDRVGLVGRNTIQGPSYASVDVRLARDFPLGGKVRGEVSVDVFNLLNRENVKDLNTNWGSENPNVQPSPLLGYLTPRDVFNPRQAQLGLKLRF